MAENKKTYLDDGYSYGESIRRHAALVAVFTVAGGFLGYYSRDFLVKHLGVEPRTGEIIGVVAGATVGFVTATIVVSEIDEAILESALQGERELLGCTKKELDQMSGEQKLAHGIKVLPEFVGPELAALIGPGLGELQGVIRSAIAQQPAPQPAPQYQQPPQWPQPWPQQPPWGPPPPQYVTPPAQSAPQVPDLGSLLSALDPATKGRIGAQLMQQAAQAAKAAKTEAAKTDNGGNPA